MTFLDKYSECRGCPVANMCGTMVSSLRLCNSYDLNKKVMEKNEIIQELKQAIKHISKGNSLYEEEIEQLIWEYYTKEDEYVVITWPEIQEFMTEKDFEENAHLINDEIGLNKYGSSSYFINKRWLIEHYK